MEVCLIGYLSDEILGSSGRWRLKSLCYGAVPLSQKKSCLRSLLPSSIVPLTEPSIITNKTLFLSPSIASQIQSLKVKTFLSNYPAQFLIASVPWVNSFMASSFHFPVSNYFMFLFLSWNRRMRREMEKIWFEKLYI